MYKERENKKAYINRNRKVKQKKKEKKNIFLHFNSINYIFHIN